MDIPITCLNGQFLPAGEARIPVSDRGFRFGDGAFETIPVIQGVPYRWESHLDRLALGLADIRIDIPIIDWHHTLRMMLEKNHASEGFLRIAVSRGDGSIGYAPAPGITPTWVIEYLPPRPAPIAPYHLWLSAYQRNSTDSLPMHHKLAQGLGSTLALMEAQDNGCEEALVLSAEDELCSAAAANLFWIHKGTLFTPHIDTGCLDGITRDTVLEISHLPVNECEVELEEFLKAEAVFLTSSRLGIHPVASLRPLGKSFTPDHPDILQLKNTLAESIDNYIKDKSTYWKNHS